MKRFSAAKWIFPPALAAIVFIGSGCATQRENSYNQDFNQSLTSAPTYLVSPINDDKFKINVNQGKVVSDGARLSDVREAAHVIAKREAMKRGWENWDVNFIREANDGWMHVVVAEVRRKKGIRY
jgi:hypothetical protein